MGVLCLRRQKGKVTDHRNRIEPPLWSDVPILKLRLYYGRKGCCLGETVGQLETKSADLPQIGLATNQKHIVMVGADDVDELFWRICGVEEFTPQSVRNDRVVGPVEKQQGNVEVPDFRLRVKTGTKQKSIGKKGVGVSSDILGRGEY